MLFSAPARSAITPEELTQTIANRPTPAGEYFGAVTEQSFDYSVPGTIYNESQVPTDDQMIDPNQRIGRAPPKYVRTKTPIMSEDEWRESPYFRESIPYDGRMTEARAKAKAEIYDGDQYNTWLRQNREMGAGTAAMAVIGSLAGAAPDPTNYIPVFGPAFKAASAGRMANILLRAGTQAVDAAAVTAAVSPMIAQSRRSFGDDVGFADIMLDIGLSAALGGTFGGVVGWRERLPSYNPELAQSALQALGEGAEQIVRGDPIDIGAAVGQLRAVDSRRARLMGSSAIDYSAARAATGMPANRNSSGVAGSDSMNLSKRPEGSQVFERGAQTASFAPPEAVGVARSSVPSQERIPKSSIFDTSNPNIYHTRNDVNELRQLAQDMAPKLTEWLQDVVGSIPGAKVYGARAKKLDAIQSKITKEGKEPNQISDYLGGRIVVDDWQSMAAVVEAIRGRADLHSLDNFLSIGKGTGYRAVHIQAKTRSGLSYELQIQPREIRDVQDEAHKVYSQFRRTADDELSAEQWDAAGRATEQTVKLFSDAWDLWLARAGQEPRTLRPIDTSSYVPAPMTDPAMLAKAEASVGKREPVSDRLAALEADEDVERVKQMVAAGTVTEAEKQMLKDADELVRAADGYAKAYDAAAFCLSRVA